jgi:hypothetical protein
MIPMMSKVTEVAVAAEEGVSNRHGRVEWIAVSQR